jgi:general secretion pathway protein A
MYLRFFGLSARPFDLTPNPRCLVLTESHREALSTLDYGIASRTGITLLLGEAGTGKTTVIRAALERQASSVTCVYLHNPALTRPEFIEMLATRFGLGEAARQSKTALLIELEQVLARRIEAGESTVLVVDEAQALPLELLEEIRLLANMETNEHKLLSVVLAGQPELGVRLNETELRQLKQRVALRCELRPLSLMESAAYVAGRVRVAGGEAATLFTREAIALMHERSRGIPRTLSVIADNALLTAFALAQRPVTRQIVLDVCTDFDLRSRADGGTPEARVVEPAAAPARAASPASVLAIGKASDSEPPAADAVAVSSERRPAVETLAPATALFHSFYPRRRRFFLF